VLGNEDLYGILGSLPGARVGGSKPQRLERIVDYFDRMVFRDVPAEAPPGELNFRYLVELAARDREVLLAPTTATAASRSAAAATSVYDLPPSHQKQFKRYIRDSPVRVACFLVIAPSISPAAAHAAARLKTESGTDTDVADQGTGRRSTRRCSTSRGCWTGGRWRGGCGCSCRGGGPAHAWLPRMRSRVAHQGPDDLFKHEVGRSGHWGVGLSRIAYYPDPDLAPLSAAFPPRATARRRCLPVTWRGRSCWRIWRTACWTSCREVRDCVQYHDVVSLIRSGGSDAQATRENPRCHL
jgi:hypothetical protein